MSERTSGVPPVIFSSVMSSLGWDALLFKASLNHRVTTDTRKHYYSINANESNFQYFLYYFHTTERTHPPRHPCYCWFHRQKKCRIFFCFICFLLLFLILSQTEMLVFFCFICYCYCSIAKRNAGYLFALLVISIVIFDSIAKRNAGSFLLYLSLLLL